MDHFFVLLSGEITKKSENTVFGYKNASKFKENIIFENFGGWLYNESAHIFDNKSLWKDLQPKAYFSLALYAEKLQNDKIHSFWLQNVVKKYILWHFQTRDPKIV